jgi:uncharacterized protein YbcI
MAMPDKTLREVAMELADRAVGQCDSIIDCKLVENAIIAGMRAALAEPSAEMQIAGFETDADGCHDLETEIFKAMAAVRLEELK